MRWFKKIRYFLIFSSYVFFYFPLSSQEYLSKGNNNDAIKNIRWDNIFWEAGFSTDLGISSLSSNSIYSPVISVFSRFSPVAVFDLSNRPYWRPLQLGLKISITPFFQNTFNTAEQSSESSVAKQIDMRFYTFTTETSYYFVVKDKIRFLTGFYAGYYIGDVKREIRNGSQTKESNDLVYNPVFGIQHEISYLLFRFLSLGGEVGYSYYHNHSLQTNEAEPIHRVNLGFVANYLF